MAKLVPMAPAVRRRPGFLVICGLWAPLAIGLPIAIGGCGSERLFVEGPPTAAVGELAIFEVSADLPCGGKVFGGPSDPTGDLMVCHPFHKITKVLTAACDDTACAVESVDVPDVNGTVGVNVVGSVVGPTVLRVRAQLDDGSEMSATSSVSFATPTGLHVACDTALVGGNPAGAPYGQCGGLYPVFTDSSWRWTLSLDSDAGLLPLYDPSIAVQGSAVTYDASSYSFHSGSADGTAVVAIVSRLFAEDVPVRVVSTADVVSGEARLVTFSDGVEQPIAQIGPAPGTLWYPRQYERFQGDDGTVEIMSLLTLADGSQVYGGAGLYASDHPEVCTPDEFPAGVNLIQQTFLYPSCFSVGNATFSATVGAASITWPVTSISAPAAAVSASASTP
jgi:hypothetical protein